MRERGERGNPLLGNKIPGIEPGRTYHAKAVKRPGDTVDGESAYPALLMDVDSQLERGKHFMDCMGDYCSHHYCHGGGADPGTLHRFLQDGHSHLPLGMEICGAGQVAQDACTDHGQVAIITQNSNNIQMQTFRDREPPSKSGTLDAHAHSRDVTSGSANDQSSGTAKDKKKNLYEHPKYPLGMRTPSHCDNPSVHFELTKPGGPRSAHQTGLKATSGSPPGSPSQTPHQGPPASANKDVRVGCLPGEGGYN